MTIRYIIERIRGGYRATCEELGVQAVGVTVDGAVSALRRALDKRMAQVEAVPPASSPVIVRVDLQQEVEAEARPSGDADIHHGAA
jgi:hypothetical protein